MSKEELMLEHNKMINKILEQCNYMLENRCYMNDDAIKINVEKIADIARCYFFEEAEWIGIDKLKKDKKALVDNYSNVLALNEEEKEAIEPEERIILHKIIEKQKKVIDEMALHIASSAIVDDTVCMYVDCNNEECHSDTAVECTKQYFYRKVEEDE